LLSLFPFFSLSLYFFVVSLIFLPLFSFHHIFLSVCLFIYLFIYFSSTSNIYSIQWLGYRLYDRGLIPGRGRREFFFSPPRPDWHWGPSSWLSSMYWGKAVGAWRWPFTSIE
jgi:hypothetical protein